eukprot:12895514-Prorocentrum_lima.AAC.1
MADPGETAPAAADSAAASSSGPAQKPPSRVGTRLVQVEKHVDALYRLIEELSSEFSRVQCLIVPGQRLTRQEFHAGKALLAGS